MHRLLRKALNLPDKHAAPAQAPDTVPSSPAQARLEGAPSDSHPSWAEEVESKTQTVGRRAGKALLWCLALLLMLLGLRDILLPPQGDHSPTTASTAQARTDVVPTAQAQQVAAEFARVYMTWDSGQPTNREAELAVNLPGGADAKAGWNGSGFEQVAQAIPGEVLQLGRYRALVDVDVRVSVPSTANGRQVVTNSWRGLEVPVAQAGGRVIVTGQPALVGLPTSVPYTAPAASSPDPQLASATAQTVHDFLVAWAVGTQAQVAAPGASIDPLGDAISLAGLDSWTVDQGAGGTRHGTAVVRWSLAGAQLQQTYRLTISRVTASGASRWQVSAVSASG